MSDAPMRDEQDPLLNRFFAEQEQSLPARDFMVQLIARLEREQRKQRIYSAIAVVAVLFLGVLVAPWLAQAASALTDLITAGLDALNSLLLSPLVWLVAGALAFAFLPLVYVWRTWHD